MQEDFLEEEIEKGTAVLKTCEWVREEFAHSDFEDKRLYLRLLVLASDLSKQPMAYINQASGEWKFAKAAYRFFNNKKVTVDGILRSHIRKTRSRISNHSGTILAIQDTTFLNYSHMKSSKDLGPIGTSLTTSQGLVMHTVFAVTAEGLPLGFLHQDIWARDKDNKNSTLNRREKPIEEKESNKWLKAIKEQSKVLGKGRDIIAVCDREADIYQFFHQANCLEQKVIVRAGQDRKLTCGGRLWDVLSKKEVALSYKLQLSEGKKEDVSLNVRYAPIAITLNPNRKNLNNSPQSIDNLTAIFVTEQNPPLDREPLSWMLIANYQVDTEKEVLKIINHYAQRWKIEVLHRIMKSGCSIELTRLKTNKRRKPFIALKSIIAWRLMLITHYNRISPNAPATSILTNSECNALYIAKHKHLALNKKFSAKKAIIWIGELGGYLARKSDPLPGPIHIWRGWQRLQDLTKMLEIINP